MTITGSHLPVFAIHLYLIPFPSVLPSHTLVTQSSSFIHITWSLHLAPPHFTPSSTTLAVTRIQKFIHILVTCSASFINKETKEISRELSVGWLSSPESEVRSGAVPISTTCGSWQHSRATSSLRAATTRASSPPSRS